jgi:predicted SAM-dependent methyltransferase
MLNLKSSLRNRIPHGLYSALRLLRNEVNIYRLHRKGIKKARTYAGQSDMKLNIGCGPNRKQGWVNIDLLPDVDLSLDMREAMPFSENSAAIIYSEHFFEHLDYPEPAKQFLKECHRILKPGGIFSVGVPDTEWPLQAYVGPDDKNYFAWSKVNCLPEWCQTRIDDINYHFRQDGEHRFAYDYETLYHVLMEAGFSNIRQRAFDAGLDAENRRIGTLYVDAVK